MNRINYYTEEEARSNKLYCGDCGKRIKKGELVIFKLSCVHRMLDVFCERCKKNYEQDVVENSIHP